MGGGIAPKIVEKLREPKFLEAFTAKGRMAKLLQEVPIKVIVNDKTALVGVARVALFGIRMCTHRPATIVDGDPHINRSEKN